MKKDTVQRLRDRLYLKDRIIQSHKKSTLASLYYINSSEDADHFIVAILEQDFLEYHIHYIFKSEMVRELLRVTFESIETLRNIDLPVNNNNNNNIIKARNILSKQEMFNSVTKQLIESNKNMQRDLVNNCISFKIIQQIIVDMRKTAIQLITLLFASIIFSVISIISFYFQIDDDDSEFNQSNKKTILASLYSIYILLNLLMFIKTTHSVSSRLCKVFIILQIVGLIESLIGLTLMIIFQHIKNEQESYLFIIFHFAIFTALFLIAFVISSKLLNQILRFKVLIQIKPISSALYLF